MIHDFNSIFCIDIVVSEKQYDLLDYDLVLELGPMSDYTPWYPLDPYALGM